MRGFVDDFELELKQEFLVESSDLLEATEEAFLRLESDDVNASLLNEIFRLAHNLKGTSKAVGFDDLSELTHSAENLILKLKDGVIPISSPVVTLLFEFKDTVTNMVADLKEDMDARFDTKDLEARLNGYEHSAGGETREERELLKKISKKKPRKISKKKSGGGQRDVASAREVQDLKYALKNLQSRQGELEKKLSGTGGKSIASFKGHYQMRGESAKNRQAVANASQSGQLFSRLRVNMFFAPNDRLKFELAPQATKNFGGEENGNATSGGTTHTEVDFFAANIRYKIIPKLELTVGRQEMAYGDHLIIGSLPWANTGRSFDAIRGRLNFEKGWVDAFWSKIADNATSGLTLEDLDDKDLYGVYTSWAINNWLKTIDLYFLSQVDRTSYPAASSDINTVGFRALGEYRWFWYRTENAVQSGTSIEEDGYQYNLELGGKFMGSKLSVEYATAGKNYIQLYPTAHKFLGIADVLGRKNINHTAVHFASGYSDWLKFKASYHYFKRNDTSATAAGLTGGTIGTTGTSDDIGDEFDFVVNFITKHNLKLQAGIGLFNPGQYIEDNRGLDEQVQFSYLQLNANF